MTSKSNNRYHLIFVTKYRKKILVPELSKLLIEILSTEIEERKGKLIAISMDEMDHVHIMVELRPNVSVSKFVSLLKQRSVWKVWEDDYWAVFLRKYYWSGKRTLWSSGYFCCTTGDASSETVKRYIEKQG